MIRENESALKLSNLSNILIYKYLRLETLIIDKNLLN